MGGAAILAALGGTEREDTGIHLLRSEDVGRTWPDAATLFPGGHDHEMLALDSRPEPGPRGTYLVSAQTRGVPAGEGPAGFEFTLFVSRSDDDGTSFRRATHVVPSNLSFEAFTPVILSDGTLVVPFQDHSTKTGRRLVRRRAWAVISTDDGSTFSEPKLIGEGCTRSRPAAWPALAVGPPEAITSGWWRREVTASASSGPMRGAASSGSGPPASRW